MNETNSINMWTNDDDDDEDAVMMMMIIVILKDIEVNILWGPRTMSAIFHDDPATVMINNKKYDRNLINDQKNFIKLYS